MPIPKFSIQPLPVAPRPFSDELLLSWICRLAAANHVSLELLFPDLERMNSYHLNCDPGEHMISHLAVMARFPSSRLHNLLLPNQFPNLPLLTSLQIPTSSVISSNDGPSVSFPLPFCSDCAGEEEHHRRSLYWEAEDGLLTT